MELELVEQSAVDSCYPDGVPEGFPIDLCLHNYMLAFDVWTCKYGKQVELVQNEIVETLGWWAS